MKRTLRASTMQARLNAGKSLTTKQQLEEGKSSKTKSKSTKAISKTENVLPKKKKRKERKTLVDIYCKAFHVESIDQDWRFQVFKTFQSFIGKEEQIDQFLYPGSFIDVVPSLFFKKGVYVDSLKGPTARKFFSEDNKDELVRELLCNKFYDEEPMITFYGEDFTKKSFKDDSFDLLFSFSCSGEISQTCCKYIRKGGYLIANDEFGDASLAYSNENLWEFVGAFDEKTSQIDNDLEKYFSPKKDKSISRNEIRKNSGFAKSTRPYPYKINARAYLFKRK